MGHSTSKLKKPNNAVDRELYKEQKRKQKQIEEEKRRKKLAEKQKKKLAKKSKKDTNKNLNDNNTVLETSNYKIAFRMEDYDNQVALKLEDQISKKFAHFCLNQIVLAMQFYGNYQSEKSLNYKQILNREAEQNQYLDKHSILLPNAIDEVVQSRIQYKPKHGLDKHELSPLQLQTMYVVFENVEISKPDDANYDSINPICKVDIDTNIGRSKKFKGYLRLRLRETNSMQRSHQSENRSDDVDTNKTSNSSIDSYFENDVTYSKNESKLPTKVTEPQYDTLRICRDSNSSGVDVTGSEYAYITSLNTHQPLSELYKSKKLKSETLDAKVVPESCITVVEYYLDEAYNEDDDESTDSEVDVIEVKYLNSKSFFCYFATVLQDHLAQDLNLCDVEFDSATWKGASIFTKSYEIIPAIHLRCWPDCAFEWKRRTRSIIYNPLNGQQLQWPTQEMIKKVESFGCHVIPMGFAPKTGKNPYRELEWKIIFPKAERYLETHLTDTQVKIFMVSKLLIKTFLEQKRDIFMFTMDHLRMHLFWECEKNCGAWPEEFLGEVLLRFLKSFLERTTSKCLPDYFITGRNLFECIPESTLVRIHQIISQIVQNPVMHLLAAYRNLEQIEPFFPKLNYKKLYSIIVVDNPLNLIDQLKTCVRRNPILMQMGESNTVNKKKEFVFAGYDDINSDEENKGLIGFSHKQERRQKQGRRSKRLKSRGRLQSVRRKTREVKSVARESIDSIEMHQYIFTTNLDELEREKRKNIPAMDDIRRSLTIEMFIRQFIHQAKASYELKSLDKTRIYLNQAARLCNFLAKYNYEDGAKKFLDKIEKMKNSFGSLSQANGSNENPPELPERTSLEPIKSFRLEELSSNKNHSEPVLLRNQDSSSAESQRLRNEKVRSVHFDEENSFEPRTFTFEADVHNHPNDVLKKNDKDNRNSNQNEFVKQKSSVESFNPNKILRASSIRASRKQDSFRKHVQIEPRVVTIQRMESFKPKKQISIEESPKARKSILKPSRELSVENTNRNTPKMRVTLSAEDLETANIPNGLLKRPSIDSNSSQGEIRDQIFSKHLNIDDDNNLKLASFSSDTTISEIEENTAGLTFKELFERRKNLIHRKLVSSLVLQQEDDCHYSSESDVNENSTDL
ncbi:uncharacterized protein LOC129605316 [Condylostylus longicornis]|uniref:uncharacterized protein LOC129605316 n=1 Tax=Condylostylus longicornis TaxID=2530218 RepID=UPI00244E2F43|nr:uncharacterized protein LOC129605316 [Condylostylus longicornis]